MSALRAPVVPPQGGRKEVPEVSVGVLGTAARGSEGMTQQPPLMTVASIPSEIVTAVWTSSQLGGFTRREMQALEETVESKSLHLFCGQSTTGDVRVDLDATSAATLHDDVLDYLADTPAAHYQTVIADPPYNGKYQQEYAVKGRDFGGNEGNLGRLLKEMFRVCSPGGVLIFKHWFDPAWAGSHLEHQVVTKYGGHRRITILTVYRKSAWGLNSG